MKDMYLTRQSHTSRHTQIETGPASMQASSSSVPGPPSPLPQLPPSFPFPRFSSISACSLDTCCPATLEECRLLEYQMSQGLGPWEPPNDLVPSASTPWPSPRPLPYVRLRMRKGQLSMHTRCMPRVSLQPLRCQRCGQPARTDLLGQLGPSIPSSLSEESNVDSMRLIPGPGPSGFLLPSLASPSAHVSAAPCSDSAKDMSAQLPGFSSPRPLRSTERVSVCVRAP